MRTCSPPPSPTNVTVNHDVTFDGTDTLDVYANVQGTDLGSVSDAVDTISSAVTAFRSTGATVWMPSYLSYLARAYAELGRFEEAWHCTDEAMAIIGTSKETWFESEINRVAGEIAL